MVNRTMPALLRDLRNRMTSVERRLARGSYQLPPRLQQTGAEVTDWNDAVQVGFYWSAATAANRPVALPLVGQVFYNADVEVIEQVVHSPSLARVSWRRTFSGGAWSAWAESPSILYSERASGNIGGITNSWVQVAPISIPLTLARAARVRFALTLFTYSTSLGDVAATELRDGATGIQSWTNAANSSLTTAATGQVHFFECLLPVAAGSHTFTVWIHRAVGTGTITVAPSAVNLCWLSAEVVG